MYRVYYAIFSKLSKIEQYPYYFLLEKDYINICYIHISSENFIWTREKIKMKNCKKVLASGLALTLLFSQGITNVDAKAKVVDKNKNGISDKWEKKYKLKGKSMAKMDYDKDGLTTLIEYKLNLNPKKADTDKDKVLDGQEDSDKDGVTNASEVELGLNPKDSDTDNDKIKDGSEKSKAGAKLSKTIKELKFEIKSADDKEIKVEYKYNKKGTMTIKIKDETSTLTKEMISSLVSEFQDTSKLTSDEILAKIQTILKVTDLSKIEFEVEYFNGHDFDIEKEYKNDDKMNNKK